MKNFLIYFLTIVFLLNSCSKKEETKLKFWHFWSEPNQSKVIKDLINKFEADNNCKVEITELTWNDGKTKLMFAFNSETAPDVLELGSDWVAQFSSSEVLYELNYDSLKINDYLDFSIEPTRWNNKFYAVPWVIDTRVMFYNKDLLEKSGYYTPPKTIDDMLKISIDVFDNGNFGYGTNGSDPHRLYKKILPFFWTYGGKILNDSGYSAIFSENNIKALTKYVELSRTGIIETQREIDAQFAQGKVAFWNSGSWLFKKLAKSEFKYDIFTLPGSEIEQKGISFAGGEYLAINSKSKHIELSKKLLKFLTSDTNSLDICQKIPEAGFPANKIAFENEYFINNPQKRVFFEQLKSSKMTPVHPKWLEIEAIIENAVVEALLDKKSPYSALLDAHHQINNLLK